MSSFSPITPVCSTNFSATVIPPKSAAKKDESSGDDFGAEFKDVQPFQDELPF